MKVPEMNCKLPTIPNFLCCYPLETGGIVLGWLSAVLSGIAIVSMIAFLALGAGVLFFFILIIFVLYFAIQLYAAIQLIRGTRNRNHQQMKWFLWLMAVGVILSFLQIPLAGVVGIFPAIIVAGFYVYFFLCIYSLYESVKN